MKKISIIVLVFVLTATVFAGCRKMDNNTTGSTAPGSSTSTKPTIVPAPEITTSPTTSTTEMPARNASRPSAKGPRY